MNKPLEALLASIYSDEDGNVANITERSLKALSAAGLPANREDVKGALLTCHDELSFAWDLIRFARGDEDL